ncbi:hypothetical protein VOLCADRAFT_116664 [Volvox carteri f. nagariensis]|uniref:Uncharacterized protein n=1 Tax=Volvox carteri f. nagariensis TaxID=3068 RepID=D8TN77_VOLCA|nr:uncharacterized protein VOLCADRAFT_116664 [Volvox carteri f. nagariensis]EFJ51092.1 hypothetical protein VOLCADRAFT_116664 [Volvox carteri f. nagariensis]|eukprot:XP_002948104.1 hypothetical protein VOLCADRAFT_116664 [Volvox carteri f. nagariensis]
MIMLFLDVASFVRAMASNTNLTELYCSSHPLAPHTASLLADMLAASPSLQSLCVGDSSLGDDGVAALARGVAASSLTRLDLCNKGLGLRGAAALCTALAAAPSLTHLLLNSNPKLSDDGLHALCGAAVWAGLRVLEIQGCGVTCSGVRALAASPSCYRLEVLRLDGNPLGPEGGKAIGELLGAAPQLRELSLRGTELGDQGGEELAAALKPRSKSTSRSGSTEAAVGAVDLRPAPPSRSPLLRLGLEECGLGPRAMAAFRDAFFAGARLAALCLAGNTEVSDGDVAQLGGPLGPLAGAEEEEEEDAEGSGEARPPRLTHLDVSGTSAGPQAVAALSRAVGLRHLSMSLEVGANPGTQEGGFQELLDVLRTTRPNLALYWRSGNDPAPPQSGVR